MLKKQVKLFTILIIKISKLIKVSLKDHLIKSTKKKQSILKREIYNNKEYLK